MNIVTRKFLKMAQAEEILYRFPEGRRKFMLRRLALRLFTAPRPTAFVNEGDNILHAGVWRIETVEDWVEAVGPDGNVIIVEADPENAKILQIEQTRRELENVTVINRAVWNEPDEVEFLVSPVSCRNMIKESETHVPHRPSDSYPEKKTVKADTLDNIIEMSDVEDVDHIHTQISGAEIEAIEGLEKTLQKPPIRIWIRAIHVLDESENPANKKVAEMLRERGLTVVHGKEEPDRHGGNVYGVKYT